MVGGCGLAGWETNSVVVHAVSRTGPAGPFDAEPVSVAVGSYAHNPQALYLPRERLYLLLTLGSPNASAPVPCSEADGTPAHSWGGEGAPPWLSVRRRTVRRASRPHGTRDGS